MTIFQRLALGLLIVLGPATSWACEAILKSSPRQISPKRLILPHATAQVQAIASESLFFAVPHGRDAFWTIIFDKDDSHKNRGHLIEGKMRDGAFLGYVVRRSSPDAEKDYFKAVARMHNLHSQTISLTREHARCESIEVNSWIEAKLLLKHGLTLHQVKTLLETAQTERIYDDGHRDPRYRVKALDGLGRSIAIVIAEKENCPNVLVTAYAESDEE